MIRDVLIVSGTSTMSNEIKDKVQHIVNMIHSSNKNVHFFKEDLLLLDLIKGSTKIFFIESLTSPADKLLFKKNKGTSYSDTKDIPKVNTDYSIIQKKSIKRYVVPNRENVYDIIEYNTIRDNIVANRSKYVISQIASQYSFIINITKSKDVNLLNGLEPTFGDGKFIYELNAITNESKFFIGGCITSEENFERCIKEM